jgi:type IV pilus assembly protein PilW
MVRMLVKIQRLKPTTLVRTHLIFCGNDSGFTLMELLIAMAVGLVVLAVVFSVFTIQSKQLNKQDKIAEMQQNARMAMEIMAQDIMMAGYGVSTLTRCTGTTTATSTPCLGISAANANSISFTSDLNGNVDLTANSTNPNENITYNRYSSSGIYALGRTSNGSKQPVVENVNSLAFSYLDAAGAVTANLASIRTIQISITTRTARIDPDSGNYKYFTLTKNVTPRNLGAPGY